MAKNYRAKDAISATNLYVESNGKEGTQDYRLFASKFPSFAAAILTGDVETILMAIPYASARAIEKGIMKHLAGEDAGEGAEGADVDDEDEAEEKAPPAPPAPPAATAKGKGKKAAPPPTEDDEDEDDEEDDEEESKYAGMSPKKLHALCTKRELKAAPGKSAEYYIEKLENADKKAAEADDDEEEEEETPKKGKGKPATKKGKVEDDEDWDF